MTDVVKEQISAFLDDELSADEAQLVVHRLMSDPELLEQARTMLTVGHRVRGERSIADAGFASRVVAAAAGAPAAATAATVATEAGGAGRWLKLAGGGVVAAGVAAVALLAVRAPDTIDGVDLNGGSVAETAEPAGLESFEYTVPATTTSSGLVVADPQLAGYLLNHSARSPSMMPGGMRGRILISDEQDVTDNNGDAEPDSGVE